MDDERWRQVEQLYHAALECDPAERAVLLAQADSGVRREVELLLARISGAGPVDSSSREPIDPTATLVGAGMQVGPYRIESPLGAGGMGQVYRARDTRLGRSVAVKFLSTSLAASRPALERFRREAHAISALNHSNICTIHDIGEERGHPFLVMELLEGQDLKQRMTSGQLELPEILAIGVAICEGLEAAHSRGLVHRDIKPANIFLTSQGGVKILDFGLAKPAGAQDASLTETGLTLGTLAYMAPEQARGQEVDTRADLFSLGVVLYEMAAGQRPFSGATPAVIFEAILNRTPRPARELNPRIPLDLDRIISKALQKDPAVRYQTASALKADLQLAQHATGPAVAPRALRVKYALLSLLALLLIAAAYFAYRQMRSGSRAGSQWTQITALEAATQPSLSADGRALTFVGGASTFFGKGEIYVKLLPDGPPVRLTNDGTAKMGPVFSPDGARIAYTVITNNFTWNTWTVPVLGGEPRIWLPNAAALKWIDSDHVLFSEITQRAHMLLSTASESRTNPRIVYDPPHDRGMVHRFSLSPDRKSVVLVEMDNRGWLPCRVVPFDGSSSGRQVGPATGACTDAAWSRDGRWIYLSSSSGGSSGGAFHIWRQRFPQGQPEQITFGPTQEEGIWMAPDGNSLLTSAGIDYSHVWIHTAQGEGAVPAEGSAHLPTGSTQASHVFSADDGKVFYLASRPTSRTPGSELWVTTLGTGASEVLFPGVEVTGYDVAADNQHIAYVSPDSAGVPRLWTARLDRRTSPRQVTDLQADSPCFAGNGVLFFRAVENRFNFVYRLDGQGRPQKVVTEPIIALRGCSPDAQWLLVNIVAPNEEIPRMWVAYPVSGGQPVPICQECWPMWSRDGRILYVKLSSGSGQMGPAKNYAIQLSAGSILLKMPAAITSDNIASLAPIRTYEQNWIHPGGNPSTFAFERNTVQRNIYRIPLP